MNFNPLYEGFGHLNDQELDEKMQDLTKKYFQTSRYPEIQHQINILIDMCREEQQRRLYEKYYKNDKDDDDLDNLINVN